MCGSQGGCGSQLSPSSQVVSLWQAPLQPGAGLGSVDTPSCCCLPSSVSVTGLHLSLTLVPPWTIRLLTSQWQLSFPFFFEFWDKALPCDPGWSWAQDPLVSAYQEQDCRCVLPHLLQSFIFCFADFCFVGYFSHFQLNLPLDWLCKADALTIIFSNKHLKL